MIDIHCHILPGVDDGPETMDDAISMARRAAADGITHIVATPHVNTVFPLEDENFSENEAYFENDVFKLSARLKNEGLPIDIFPGAEIAAADVNGVFISMLGMNNTRYLLIEFPHTHLPANAGEVIFSLKIKGYCPIIAHPERNPSIIDTPQKLMNLRNMGALVQITADSLTHPYDPDVRQCAMYLVKKGAVEFIASDAHSHDSRPPVLSGAYKVASKLVGEKKARMLVRSNQVAMIRGKAIGCNV